MNASEAQLKQIGERDLAPDEHAPAHQQYERHGHGAHQIDSGKHQGIAPAVAQRGIQALAIGAGEALDLLLFHAE